MRHDRLGAVHPQQRLHKEVRQANAVDDLFALLPLHVVQLDGQHAPVDLVHLPAEMLQLLGGRHALRAKQRRRFAAAQKYPESFQ